MRASASTASASIFSRSFQKRYFDNLGVSCWTSDELLEAVDGNICIFLWPPSLPPSHSSVELSRSVSQQSLDASRQRDTEKPFLAAIIGREGIEEAGPGLGRYLFIPSGYF